jgi:ABC-type multidrug transport system ATPase subunit
MSATSKRGIGWSDITWTVDKKKTQFKILSECSGYVHGGDVLAIMGPSGCGKTSLLDILSGRTRRGNMRGWMCFNDSSSPDGSLFLNYVPQEDSLLGSFTVAETLQFAFSLGPRYKLDETSTKKFVDETIQLLGLDVCRDTIVGDVFSKGISGGQKRRLSLGVALLSEPKGLLLDEPTSGLDSASALGIVKVLRSIGQKYDIPICTTIHQPSSEIWHLFTKVCLLSKGRVIYFGDTANTIEYFNSLGYPCPAYSNPADFFLSLINQDFEGHADIAHLEEMFRKSSGYQNTQEILTSGKMAKERGSISCQLKQVRDGPSTVYQFWQLLKRNLIYSSRNPGVIIIRLIMYSMLSVMMGLMFFNNGNKSDDAAIQARVSAIFFIFAFMVFMSISVLPFYIMDKATYDRERMNNDYQLLPFVLAQFVSTIPGIFLISLAASAIVVPMMALNNFPVFLSLLFLSLLVAEGFMAVVALIVPQFIIGIAMAAGVYGMFMLCEGFFQIKSEIPDYLIWIYYTGFHTYSFRSAMYTEFHDDGTFDDAISPTLNSGDAVLNSYDMSDVNVGHDVAVLLANVIGFQIIFALLVYYKGSSRLLKII